MIDPELRSALSGINQHLVDLKNKKSPGIWRAFFNGMFGALGYVAGIAIVVVVLGWILQKTGLLKPFQDQIKSFSEVINGAKKLMSTDSNQPSNTQQQGSGGESTITLPDGRQYKINVQQ